MKNAIKLAIVCAIITLSISCNKTQEPKPEIPLQSQKELEAKKAQSTVPAEIATSAHSQEQAAPDANSNPHANQGAPGEAQPEGHAGMGTAQGHASNTGQPHHKLGIVVPDSVKGKWESVKLSIADKTKGKTVSVNVKLGQEYKIPDSTLSIKVGDFLPDFRMDSSNVTSMSNETNNPAVNVTIADGGKELFNGWLYSKYPQIHPFEHDRFSVVLDAGIKKN